MNDLGWRADGIERAVASGGVVLEVYRRPGFTGGKAVRQADTNSGGGGMPVEVDTDIKPDIEIINRRDPLPPR